MKARPWTRQALIALAALVCASAAHTDTLQRLQAQDTSADDGLVHCLFPGQVRRLGAFSTSVTPRRAARVAPQACAAGGGEYIELQDHVMAATKVWGPLAADGVPEAQVTLGELYEQQGKTALARAWYEKAAAQGVARARFNLAAMLLQQGASAGSLAADSGASAQGSGAGSGSARVEELLIAASGGGATGLVFAPKPAPSIEFMAPVASPLPRPTSGVIEVQAPAGPATVVARVSAPLGVQSVEVNGVRRELDAQGFLEIPVAVGASRAHVQVQAVDRSGQSAQASMALVQRSAPLASAEASPGVDVAAVLAAQPPASGTPMPPVLTKGRRLALVIGNQAYKHWTPLETPGADSRAVASALQQRFGFQVTSLFNATRQQILSALSRLRQQAGPDDQVVVYYAGHGQMDPDTARGYWIPVDAEVKDLSQWVSVIDVTDQLAAMSARHVMVIADSCYSGTLMRSLIPSVDQAIETSQRQAPLAHLARQRVRVAMTSGGLEPVVDGGSIEHSLFARSLLDTFHQVQGPVAAQEFFSAVSARFAHLSRRLKLSQQPQYAPIGFAGHEAGDFVLVPL